MSFIHRFVVFFKPYSGKEYSEFSIISIVLAVLLITLSIQSKLSEKANLLVERLHDLWHGETTLKEEKKPKKKVIAEKPQVQQTPTVTKAPAMVEQPTQELPNYNMMYHNTAAPEMPHSISTSFAETSVVLKLRIVLQLLLSRAERVEKRAHVLR